ncbi:hypothetical protein OBV_27190 [Oscillibacter valericigenes Sjm18-20]|nr:hypothetical protein OBV_27190 [Oscillibacter valericigenes Sjm18-20]
MNANSNTKSIGNSRLFALICTYLLLKLTGSQEVSGSIPLFSTRKITVMLDIAGILVIFFF